MLLTRIWGDSAYRDPRTIDVHIRHLREKLEIDAKDPEYLFTVRGVGYRFRDTRQVAAADMRSLATRLTLLFVLVAAVAVGVVYAYVVPPLESSLRDEKLDTLLTDAQRYTRPIEQALVTSQSARTLNRLVRTAADRSYDRVTLLGVTRGTEGVQTFVRSDSTSENEISDLQFAVAAEAARTGRPQKGTEASDRGRVGEAAVPLFYRRRALRAAGRRLGRRLLVTRRRRRRQRRAHPPAHRGRRRARADRRPRRRRGRGGTADPARAARCAASRCASAAATSPRASRSAARTSSASSPARWTTCSASSRSSTRRASGSSPSPRTSCAPRSSPWAASSSCSPRRTSTRRSARAFLQQLREQVDRLGKLATDLLDLSTLEAGSLELRPEPVDLRMLARAVSDEFAPALATHDSQIELRLPKEPVAALCDPERVSQVMRILIDNALTHTPRGTDMVVTAGVRDGHVRLGVGDFGPGIHRTMLPRIFEPFITSDDAQGSGLGLAIAHELAERMAGELRVESQPGRTTFTLELPEDAVA